jgi:SnoaL-like domain
VDLVSPASEAGEVFSALAGDRGVCGDEENAMDRRNVLKAAALMAVGVGLPPVSSKVRAAERINARRNPMSNANEIVVRYLKAWNERDAKRRRDLIAQTWTEDGTYIDRVREGRSHDSIDAMIDKVQAEFVGYTINLASGIEAHHDYVRFSWAAGGTAEAPLYIKGTDFFVIADDGRLKSVVGFVDAAPVPAAQL